eukprot:10816643-Heterocapsa_arctica.AAC.1
MAMGRVRRDLGFRHDTGGPYRLSTTCGSAERSMRERYTFSIGRGRLSGFLCESGEKEREQNTEGSRNMIQSNNCNEGRTLREQMDEQEMEDAQLLIWRWHRTEESYVLANQNVYPTNDMATMIKLEDLMTARERRLCMQRSMIMSTVMDAISKGMP